MSAYASGKRALGICDRCGFGYLLSELKDTVVRKKRTGLRVCPECWEKDHPQNAQGTFKIVDPQALRHPSPDTDRVYAIGVFGWNPVFVQAMVLRLGTVSAA